MSGKQWVPNIPLSIFVDMNNEGGRNDRRVERVFPESDDLSVVRRGWCVVD